MTDIRTGVSPLGTGFQDTQFASAGKTGAAATGTPAGFGAGIDLDALTRQFLAMAAGASTGTVAASGRDAGRITDASGAPALAPPTVEYSAEDMAAMLQNLQSKTADAQLKTTSENLKTAKLKTEENHSRQMAKIKEWADKTAEAADKAKSGKVLGWLGKIAGFVAAVVAVAVAAVATVATAGAAAPLLAIAVIGMVGAGMSLANQISKEHGGPEIGIGTYLNQGCAKLLQAMGVDEKTAQQAGKIMGGAIGVMSGAVVVEPGMLGSMTEGIAVMSGADEKQAMIVAMTFTLVATVAVGITLAVCSGGTSVAGDAARMGQMAQAAGSITAGAYGIGEGVLTIEAAKVTKDADNAQADRKLLSAMMNKLAQQMEDDRENIKKVLDEIQQGSQLVSQMLAGASESRSQLAANMGGGRSRMA